MDAAIEVNPDWLISNACRRAESISKAQAKALGEYFKVAPSLFI
ncbi:MAG: hypothetical protein QNJ70_30090 [Xenococcaceae cyanobacterium MO_207.B15]|nr:hypothetical protein [Xenococcaceae cyanobacterium MO_207.B15]MDJ0746576.1 hypothetical protein [Xenococcaceae cyanobacterium MO_167.B27]